MTSNNLIKQTEEFAKPFYKLYKKNPRMWKEHIPLVRYYTKKLCEIEGLDSEPLEIAAILHDIGKFKDKKNHHEVSVELSKDFLENTHLPKNKIELIQECILKHRDRFVYEDNPIEVKIIQCADALAVFFDDEWQEFCRKSKTKEHILEKYDKKMEKVTLDSAKKIAVPQVNKLKALL